MSDNVVVINHGKRTYALQPITQDETYKLADGVESVRKKVIQERLLKPGESIQTLDEKEANLLLGYHDIKDAAKVVPANDAKIKALEAEIARLNASNKKLAEPAPAPKAAEERSEEHLSSKKKGR